jgi:tripartite-type tricarboxylate transporter receptor subunit TctC
MKLHRRKFLHLAAGGAALPVVSRTARADAYPSRPVRIVVGFAAGGASDIAARLIGQTLSDRLGQPFVIENRPGASGNIATEVVVRATPDGYTLQMAGQTDAVNATLYDHLNFNFSHDIAPVAGVIRQPLVMVVHPSVPAKNVPEFIDYAKANPGRIDFGSPGNGTPPHLAGELFKMMAGVDMVHVAYRGGAPAVIDLISGRLQILFITALLSIEHIKTGKLRALAVTGTARSEALPEIPTVGDFLPGYEASFWVGIGAPRNTPVEIIEKLNKEINAALQDPKMKAHFADIDGTSLAGSPADFGKLFADETEKWGKVIRSANIKPE